MANYALSNEHLCELYMTTEIVSAKSQGSLTDCDMDIDRIANVQKRNEQRQIFYTKCANRQS